MSLPPQLRKISDTIWELPVTYKEGMRVPARIIASESLLSGMEAGVFDQAANVACLPGIINYSYCMPDGHWGYGFRSARGGHGSGHRRDLSGRDRFLTSTAACDWS